MTEKHMLLRSASPVRRAAVVMTLLALAPALVSCGTDTPPAPDGFTSTTVRGFHFAYPSSWSEIPSSQRAPAVAFEVAKHEGGRLLYSGAVEFSQSNTGDIGVVVDGQVAFMRDQVDDLRVVSRKQIEMEGASGAVVVRTEYTTADGLHLTNLDMYAIQKDGKVVLLGTTSRQSSVNFGVMWKIVRSAYWV